MALSFLFNFFRRQQHAQTSRSALFLFIISHRFLAVKRSMLFFLQIRQFKRIKKAPELQPEICKNLRKTLDKRRSEWYIIWVLVSALKNMREWRNRQHSERSAAGGGWSEFEMAQRSKFCGAPSRRKFWEPQAVPRMRVCFPLRQTVKSSTIK